MKEYIERNSQLLTYTDPIAQKPMSLVFTEYNKYENRVLIKTITGASSAMTFAMPMADVLRALVNNYRQDRQYWIQAVKVLRIMFLNQYRPYFFAALYPFMACMFWWFTSLRLAVDSDLQLEKVKCPVAITLFHVFGVMSAAMTFILLQRDGTEITEKSGRQDLSQYILKACENYQYEDIDSQRGNFCFDCMVVHKSDETRQIRHCSQGDKCVAGFQMYSNIFGKSIGAHNHQLYYFNLLFAFLFASTLLRQSFWSMYWALDVDPEQFGCFFYLDSMIKLHNLHFFASILQAIALVNTNLLLRQLLVNSFAISKG